MVYIKTIFQNLPGNKYWKELQDRHCTYKCNNGPSSSNYCCRGKAMGVTYSECVSVALGIQHAKRMSRIIFSPVACPALPHFCT
jgi:hypothetical protein